MKLILDFDNKTIECVGSVSLGEIHKKIKSMFPDWKDWCIIEGVSPAPYIPYTPYTQPPLYDFPIITTGNGCIVGTKNHDT